MAVSRIFASIRQNFLQFNQLRNISLSSTRNLKEIRVTKEGNTTIVEGVIIPDEKEHLTLKPNDNGACPICSLGIDVKHTDVLILRQFVRKDGCMLPRRITGLCQIQQKRIGIMVSMAHQAGLMGNLKPKNCKRGPRQRRDWKGFNTYFLEKTIKQNYY